MCLVFPKSRLNHLRLLYVNLCCYFHKFHERCINLRSWSCSRRGWRRSGFFWTWLCVCFCFWIHLVSPRMQWTHGSFRRAGVGEHPTGCWGAGLQEAAVLDGSVSQQTGLQPAGRRVTRLKRPWLGGCCQVEWWMLLNGRWWRWWLNRRWRMWWGKGRQDWWGMSWWWRMSRWWRLNWLW